MNYSDAHRNPNGTVDMIGVDADRLRDFAKLHPDEYARWFGNGLVNLAGSDREVVRDALIAIAERPDMTLNETGEQVDWLLWYAPWWQDWPTWAVAS